MSTKEAITHDNHYVPQFYLKYWSNNGNTIHSYNGILRHKSGLGWQTKPIKSTACLQDYYTDEIDGVDDDKVESLFEKSENKTRPIFEQIKSTGFISDSEMSTLIDYTIIQIARTPAFYKFSNSITESMFDQLFRNLVQNLGTEGAHPSVERVEHRDETPYLPLNLEMNRTDRTITAETCIGRHAFLSSAMSFIDGKIANILRHSHWRIISCEESLLTSDNPVVFLRFNQIEKGWMTGLQANADHDLKAVYFPITPHHLLITLFGASQQSLDSLAMTNDLCAFIQRGTVYNAQRYIYSNSSDNRVLRWRPQLIDRDAYDALEDERKSWHESNLKLEKDFFPQKKIVIT
mgnify:CR=1 FL=1